MSYIVAYVVALITFLGIDFVWLKLVMKPLFESHVGELMRDEPKLGVAAGFYVLYVVGIVYFAIQPALANNSWATALLNGAILGFLAYGTYEATNMATLKGWTFGMMFTDILWGMALTATAALGGYFAAQWASG